jgi:AcrR family transcriptional regulator
MLTAISSMVTAIPGGRYGTRCHSSSTQCHFAARKRSAATSAGCTVGGVTKVAREPEPLRSVRERLRLAAAELFHTRGYVETTIDEIAARAGVGRRTFFRHYRSKDDVIFPDHDQLLLEVGARLSRFPDERGIEAVTEAVKIVLQHYVDTRDISLMRYRLVTEVPALREREIVSVARYQRAFRERLAADSDVQPQSSLRAELVAASVVAAHNQVLRHWLRSNGTSDPFPELDQAFRYVFDTFDQVLPREDRHSTGSEVIVLAFDRSTPTSTVVAELTKARARSTAK